MINEKNYAIWEMEQSFDLSDFGKNTVMLTSLQSMQLYRLWDEELWTVLGTLHGITLGRLPHGSYNAQSSGSVSQKHISLDDKHIFC